MAENGACKSLLASPEKAVISISQAERAKRKLSLQIDFARAKSSPVRISLRKRCRLYFIYSILLLPGFCCGLQMCYGNIALPAHQEEGAHISLNIEVGSWFVSLLSIFIMFGSLSSSVFASLLGRRGCLFGAIALITLGLVVLHLAPSFHYLLAGRILCGIGTGIALPTSYLLLHETALPDHRPVLATLNILSVNVGALYILIFGWIISYTWLPTVSAIPGVLFLLTVFFVPESAAYLVQKGKYLVARDNLRSLWGDTHLAVGEIEAIRREQEALSESDFVSRIDLKSSSMLVHTTMLMLMQSFSGCDTLYNYFILIARMAKLEMNGNLLSILVQLGFVVGFLLAPILVRRCSRKPHFIMSSVALSLCLFFVGLGVSKEELEVSGGIEFGLFQILPISSVLAYSILYGLGLGSLPFTMLGELLPSNWRNLGLSLATFSRYASVFALLKLFPATTECIGLHGLFWFHAICCFLGALYVHFLIPETNNCFE